VFSTRLPSDLATNRLTQTLKRLRVERCEILDLTESNPTRAGFTYPPDLLTPLGDSRGLAYDPQPFGALDARRAVSAEYARRGANVPPDHLVLTASTSEAYSLLFKVLCDPGDEVLVPRPSYPLLEHLTRLEGVVAAPYDLEYDDCWSIDLGSLERACSDRTRIVLIVSPNNPTGSFVKVNELEHLAAVCARRQLAIVADEVFADYELRPGAATAAGRTTTRDDALVFSLGGLSKSIGLPQVKLGWMGIGGPDALVAAALDRLDLIADTYLSVSTPVQLAAPLLIERGHAVRTQIQARIEANLRALERAVARAPGCTLLYPEAGWTAVLRVPATRTEEDLVLDLLEEDRVLIVPGYFYDFPREAYLVVSLLPDRAVFNEAVKMCHDIARAGEDVPHDGGRPELGHARPWPGRGIEQHIHVGPFQPQLRERFERVARVNGLRQEHAVDPARAGPRDYIGQHA